MKRRRGVDLAGGGAGRGWSEVSFRLSSSWDHLYESTVLIPHPNGSEAAHAFKDESFDMQDRSPISEDHIQPQQALPILGPSLNQTNILPGIHIPLPQFSNRLPTRLRHRPDDNRVRIRRLPRGFATWTKVDELTREEDGYRAAGM